MNTDWIPPPPKRPRPKSEGGMSGAETMIAQLEAEHQKHPKYALAKTIIENWQSWLPERGITEAAGDAALRAARDEAFEEAAKIAESLIEGDPPCRCRACNAKREVAAAIRERIGKGEGGV